MTEAARIFKALADPTRRQILQELRDGELCAGDIVSRFAISGPAVSRHLSVLRAADLLSERRDGTRIYYRALGERLAHCLSEFIGSVCPSQARLRADVERRQESGDEPEGADA